MLFSRIQGYFNNAKGTSYDDAIFGTSNANTISADAGDDFVWSYGGGDSIDGGIGLDTLVFTENVTDLVFSSAPSGALSFTKSGSPFATVTGFENYRFGYGTSLSKDITAAQLKAYIVDSPATINTTLTGVAKEDEELGLKVVITDADGVGTYGLQWQSKASSGAWADISGQSDGYLLLTQSQVNQTIRAKVSYIDAMGHAQTTYSSATAAVLNVNDLPTGAVSVSGKAVAGELLTADASVIRDEDGLGTFYYQWQRSADGSEWEAIAGATTSTYRIVEADAFKSMRVVVSYVDGFNAAESVTSTSTAIVNPSNFVATGAPVIQLQSSVAIEDSRMSVNMSAVADRDGLGPMPSSA